MRTCTEHAPRISFSNWFYNQDNSDSVTTASIFRLTNSPPVTLSRKHSQWWRSRWRRLRRGRGLVGGSLSGVATSEGASSQLHRPVWRTGFCKKNKKWESFWFQVGSAVCRCVVTSCERRVVKSQFCNRVVSKWCAGALACTKNKYKLWVKGSMLPTSKRIHKAILYHIPWCILAFLVCSTHNMLLDSCWSSRFWNIYI